MSKEIKFRAWDGQRYWYSDSPNADFVFGGKGDGAFLEGELQFDLTAENIHRSTGLKDKNGVEIYEGDILHFCASWGSVDDDAVADEDNWRTQVVSWNSRRAGYEPWADLHSDAAIGEIEVIGNIYENPEFLEPRS